jgi:hypothetical protein
MNTLFASFSLKKQTNLLVFSLLCGVFCATAQTKSTKISVIDSAGHIWLGRTDGLFSVDSNGVSERILFDISDSMRVVGPSISVLQLTPENKLWIGTFGNGLHLFDPKTHKNRAFRVDLKQMGSLPSDTILAILQAKETWIATPAGLSKWLAPLDIFRTFSPEARLERNFFPLEIIADSKNPTRLWLPTADGLFLFDKKTEKLKFVPLPFGEKELLKMPVSSHVPPMIDQIGAKNDGSFFRKFAPWMLAGLLFLGFTFWILKRLEARVRRSEQLKFNIQEAENQLLRAQMNPQFIFTSLNSIKNYILSNEKILAADYLGGFALLMRNILDHSRSSRIPLRDELDTLRLYVSLEQLRFKKKFDFELRIDPTISQEDLLVQPLILQPFVESAIRHGLQNKEEKGHLFVEILHKNDHLIYKIEDDGPSRARKEAIRAAAAGAHEELKITRDRLLLQQKDATIEWTDLTNLASKTTGTRVVVSMKMVDGNL